MGTGNTLDVGTYGDILDRKLADGRPEAMARFRDYDGRVRQVRALGDTPADARRRLKAKLRDRQRATGVGLTSESRVSELADQWLEQAGRRWSIGTRRTYSTVVKNQVKPALGQLRLREAKVGVIDRALEAIYDNHGPSAAKSTKAVLSGMFRLAVRYDALQYNPLREVSPMHVRRKRARALTVVETEWLCDLIRANQHAVDNDLPDLVDWMLATGARIGETLALRYGFTDDGGDLIDVKSGTWEVNATLVRETGVGLQIQPRTKSEAGWRVVAVPPFAMAMLARRKEELRFRGPDQVVFSAVVARKLRDPSNTEHALKRVLRALGCEKCDNRGYRTDDNGVLLRHPDGKLVVCKNGPFAWATSHTFRKTVATRLEEAGRTPRQVADQLGHANPSMTLDTYFGRNVVDSGAAEVLDRH